MIRKLIREIKTHRTIRRIFRDKKNLSRLKGMNFDIDWIGRIYGIVPVDPEVLALPERSWQEQFDRNTAIDTYIKDSLYGLEKFLEELQIANLLMYPDEYEQFEGTNDFLVVLSPEHRFYSVPKFIAAGCIAFGLLAAAIALLVTL